MGTLTGQVAIVTGGGGGLGSAIARRLCEQGALVAVADVSPVAAEAVVKRLTDDGLEAISVEVDVTDADGVERMVETVLERRDRVDVLVNNAGFASDHRLTEMDDDAWNAVLAVCLYGTFACSRAVASRMMERQYGRIVNISSRAYLGNPGQANYSAAKAGVIGLTKALAKELGRHDITVNAVAPGLIYTEAVTRHAQFDLIEKRAIDGNSIRRIGQPEDVAGAVAYLVSSEASFVTGDVLHVSGGRFS